MRTKSKSTQVFEVRLWSKNHYEKKMLKTSNIFECAQVRDAKTKEHTFVTTAAELLTAIEKMYRKAEKKLKETKK